MSRAVIANNAAGFYGKLPARGDFVRAGLPRDFTDRWDAWLQSVIAGSNALMGQAWLPAFLEAPIWRFALHAGLCGERAVLGLFLPSVDKAGRYFPLTFAALHSGGADLAGTAATAWLDRCEAAGIAALEEDASPERLSAMLGAFDVPGGTRDTDGSVWWTDGSPRVPPKRIALPGMPDAAIFASMLADATLSEGCCAGQNDAPAPAATGEPGQEAAGKNSWEPTP